MDYIKGGKMAKQKAIEMIGTRTKENTIGKWAFLVGMILAVVLGLIGQLTSGWIFVLVFIGLIVGLLNIAEKEVGAFLMSGAVLILVSALGENVLDVSPLLSNILQAILAIFVPATIIVAIKNVFSLAKH